MEYTADEYSRWYIVQALFKLMHETEYEKITVTDIAHKAGVGRATFYRYFKRKEDIIIEYFQSTTKEFIFSQRYYPRCREDYVRLVSDILNLFKKQEEPFRLIRKARLEYLYLDFLNQNFVKTFQQDHPQENRYAPYLYAGMLFNLSMAWLDGGFIEPADELAEVIVKAIYTLP